MINITNECNMELMSRYKDNHFDLSIVDPPYGIGIDKAMNANKGKQGFKQYRETEWDNETPTQEYFNELFRTSKNQIIWGGNYFIDKINSIIITVSPTPNLRLTAIPMPIVINAKKIINSKGFLTGFRNLTIDNAPIIPKDKAILPAIKVVITMVIGGNKI